MDGNVYTVNQPDRPPQPLQSNLSSQTTHTNQKAQPNQNSEPHRPSTLASLSRPSRLNQPDTPDSAKHLDPQIAPLFTPWKIGSCEIKNRIVMPSMGGTNLFGWMEINHFDRAGAEFIQTVAENHVGLVLPGCQPVLNPMFGQWLDSNKKMYRDLARWLPDFHATGAKLFVQLTAGFGRSFTISSMMEKLYTNPALRKLSKPVMDLDRITASASPSPNRWSDKVPSRELTRDEIADMIQHFAASARLLADAGVDGVEVHAVHEGYVLDQFTLPYVNKRTDSYGGSFENRYRFAVEIVQAIKRACGDDFPVSLRYSAISKTKGFRQGALPGEDYTEVGRDAQEALKAARYLQDAGYDMLNCDNGTYDAWYWAHPPIYMPQNCNLPDVAALKSAVDIPLVVAGRMDPRVGAQAVADGRIDAVGFARPFLADPQWVTKLISGREAQIRPCIQCHSGCFNMSHYEGVPNAQKLSDSLHLSRCAVNAETMQTNKHYIKRTARPKEVAIVGGGIGGMECARVLALRGHQPVIYEKTGALGGVAIQGSSEDYKHSMRDFLDWMRGEMARLNVPVHLNTTISADHDFGDAEVVIATGAVPVELTSLPGHERAISALDFLDGKPVGQRVVVIGGGLTGCEIAYELDLRGSEPIIVEMQNDLIKEPGVCLANSSYLREYFALHRVPVYLNSRVTAIAEDAVTYLNETGAQADIPCDSVIISAGYRPAPLRKRPHEHLLGDCEKVGNFRTVIWSAYELAMRI